MTRLTAGLWRAIGGQARRPSGVLWRALFWIMARETHAQNEAAIRALAVEPGHAVLEVGFGHGRTLGPLMRLAAPGRVTAVDWSGAAVARAARAYG